MENRRRQWVVRCGVAVLVCLAVAAVGTAQDKPAAEKTVGVFHGEVEVSITNLYVTVLDKDGKPVPGLKPGDFEVYENGQKMPITNFSVIENGTKVTPELVEAPKDEKAAPVATEAAPRYVAILFDLPSLQRRNKRLVVSAVENLVRQGLADGDRFLIAVNSGELEVKKDFTDFEASLMATLEEVAEEPEGGDAVKRGKRLLKRTINTTQLMRVSSVPFARSGRNTQVDEGAVRAQANQLLTQITFMRTQEYARLDQAVGVADELVRALAGLDGPKAVLWIGEDLAIRPASDIYEVFYRKAANYKNLLNLTHPEMWSREMDLSRQFQHLAATAQSSGTTFHVVDASDRDREMGSADYGSQSVDDVVNSEAAGELWTPGTDITDFWDVTEGEDYMALATGGSVQKNTRDLDGAMARIRQQLSLTYYIGYERQGAPDGRVASVQVKVDNPDYKVHHHEKVLHETSEQHLSDLALSRVRFNIGDNPLGVSLVEGEPQPSDDGQVVRSIQLRVPVASLVMMPNEDVYNGEVMVAVAVLDGEGHTADPRLMKLSIKIPADRYQADALAARTLRLKMQPNVRRVAIGLRDDTSGVTSSSALDFVPQ